MEKVLLIRGGTVVTVGGSFPADVLCREGRIAALLAPGAGRPEGEVLDASGCYVLPGGVDAHVHLQMPVGEIVSADDFMSGTIAAACGGTTTVVDFATQERGQPLEEAVALRRAEADGKVAVDYSLHLAVTDASEETLRALPRLVEAGYASFKLYTVYPALGLEDGEILCLLKVARETGAMPLVHCENRAIVEHGTRRLLAAGKREPRYHPQARPDLAEAEAVRRILALAETADSPVCIAHLSTRRALGEVCRARTRGQRVYIETCPQYLLLTEEEYARPGFEGAKYVLTPPLRKDADREALWTALAQGEVDLLSTDHCPWNYRGQKERGREDFSLIPNGLPGIETRLVLLWSEGVGKGRLSPERFVALTATNPARLFGLYPRKGAIAPGADADLAILDPARRVTLRAEALHQRVDYCPYEGWEVVGYPRDVLVRGRPVVREGRFVGEAGWGTFVPRRPGAWIAGGGRPTL
ncbi:MAG: dihydropyrimidinase [Chloroflexia bacterium]